MIKYTGGYAWVMYKYYTILYEGLEYPQTLESLGWLSPGLLHISRDDYVVKTLIFTYHTYSAIRSQSKAKRWASLVAQWWRVGLPMQETQVRSVIWKDPTCCWAAKPVGHNYWGCALEPGSCNYWACAPQQEKPPQWEAHTPHLRRSPHSPQSEKSMHCNKDPEHLTMNK